MSRPANLEAWATDDDYPAGSDDWSNQPTKVVHPGPATGFVPNQGAAAEYFNELFNKLTATVNGQLNFLGQIQVQNWPYVQVTDLGAPAVWCQGDAAWNEATGLWVSVAVESGTGNRVLASPTGRDWVQLGADFGTDIIKASVVVDTLTGHLYASAWGEVYDFDGSTWTGHATSASRTLSTGKWFASKAVFVGSEATPLTKISTYTTAAGHTNRTVPATVTDHSTWASAVSDTIMLAVPVELVGVNLKGMTTLDGITWTAATIPTIAGEQIVDVCFGEGVFMLAVAGGVFPALFTGYTKIYTSATGATGSWTLVRTIDDKFVNALACTGTLWFAAYGLDDTAEPSLGMCSLDGGLTWGPCDGFLGLLADNVRGRIANSGRQLLARMISGQVGTSVGSLIAGLPPAT